MFGLFEGASNFAKQRENKIRVPLLVYRFFEADRSLNRSQSGNEKGSLSREVPISSIERKIHIRCDGRARQRRMWGFRASDQMRPFTPGECFIPVFRVFLFDIDPSNSF